jgi:hypothetical protein
LHRVAAEYAITPARLLGYADGTWEGYLVTIHAHIAGQEAKLEIARQMGMVFPTLEIR